MYTVSKVSRRLVPRQALAPGAAPRTQLHGESKTSTAAAAQGACRCLQKDAAIASELALLRSLCLAEDPFHTPTHTSLGFVLVDRTSLTLVHSNGDHSALLLKALVLPEHPEEPADWLLCLQVAYTCLREDSRATVLALAEAP